MRWTTGFYLGGLLLIVGSALAQGPEPGPVAAWTFNGERRGVIADVTANRHHTVPRAEVRLVCCPGSTLHK